MIVSTFRAAARWLRGRDLFLLGGLLALVGLSWAFLELAEEVTEGDAHELDVALLRLLRDDSGSEPVGPPWLTSAMANITALGSGYVATLVVLLVFGFLVIAGKPRIGLLVVACGVGTALGTYWLKALYDRGRPSAVSALQPASGLSFPSGHAMISVALYLTLGVLIAGSLKRFRLRVYVIGAAALLAFLIGFSRVYLGVHYPSDVLAGWTVGLGWALVCGLVERALQRRGTVERGAANDAAKG